MSTVEQLTCPDWCDDHDANAGPGEDYCRSRQVTVAGYELLVSAGTLDGQLRLFMYDVCDDDAIPLDQARELAQAIVDAVDSAEATR